MDIKSCEEAATELFNYLKSLSDIAEIVNVKKHSKIAVKCDFKNPKDNDKISGLLCLYPPYSEPKGWIEVVLMKNGETLEYGSLEYDIINQYETIEEVVDEIKNLYEIKEMIV